MGKALAINNLGMYMEGRGVPRDDTEAIRLFRRSMDDAAAMVNLGSMYAEGRSLA